MLICATEKLTAASTYYRDMQEYEKGVFKFATAQSISHKENPNISPKCFQL